MNGAAVQPQVHQAGRSTFAWRGERERGESRGRPAEESQ
jgi:hypothetical protein